MIRVVDYPTGGVTNYPCRGNESFDFASYDPYSLTICNNHYNSGGILQVYLSTVSILAFQLTDVQPQFNESQKYYTYSQYASTDLDMGLIAPIADGLNQSSFLQLIKTLTYILSSEIPWQDGAPESMHVRGATGIAEGYEISLIFLALTALCLVIGLFGLVRRHPDLNESSSNRVGADITCVTSEIPAAKN